MNKKTYRRIPVRLLLAGTMFALTDATLQAAEVVNNRPTASQPFRQQLDTGKNLIQVEFNSSGRGRSRITYRGGDIQGGTWATIWNVTAGQSYLKVGKHFVAGSPGYPKTLSSVPGWKRIKYRGRVQPGTRTRGSWQLGAYLWLDDNPGGNATHEINFWNRSFSKTRPYTFLGTLRDDGAIYRLYRRNPFSHFTPWVLVRQDFKLGANINFRKFTNFLRGKGLPNHKVINILTAVEGHNNGSSGTLRFSGYLVPAL